MSLSVSVRRGPVVGTQDLGVSRTISSGQRIQISETIPALADGLEVAMAALAAKITYICFIASANMTVKTNSDSEPDLTIALTAGVPREWGTGDLASNPIEDDIASLFVDSTDGGLLTVVAIVDPT